MKVLWVRMGVSLNLTDEEVEKLLGDNQVDMKEREKIITSAVNQGRFEVDGECYAPRDSIADFNDANDTDYEEYDYEFFW